MGGYGPTPEPEFFLKKTGADVVALGEGEITICKLMEELAKQKKKPVAMLQESGYKKFQVWLG